MVLGYLLWLSRATPNKEEALRMNLGELHGGLEPLTYVMAQKAVPKADYDADKLYLLRDSP